ncbi:hypothetical protein V2J09_014889, partial [Rumex salicifolius]
WKEAEDEKGRGVVGDESSCHGRNAGAHLELATIRSTCGSSCFASLLANSSSCTILAVPKFPEVAVTEKFSLSPRLPISSKFESFYGVKQMLRHVLLRYLQSTTALPATFPFPLLHLSSSSLNKSRRTITTRSSIRLNLSSSTEIRRSKIRNRKIPDELRLCCNCYSSSSSPSHACVVASDGKYGSKQVISMTPRLYDYVLDNVREPEILRKLREETAEMRGSQMQVSPDQAQLLAMLVQLLGAKRCIEVGVYTGYSSLAIALVLPDSGCLVACERDDRALEVATRYFEQAGVLHKVNVKHGMAIDTLKLLLANGEARSYDFAFVDADKRMYPEYFEILLQLVRVGGVVVIDNVLWHGNVADPLVNDKRTISIRDFNRNLLMDARVDISTYWRWNDNLPQKMIWYEIEFLSHLNEGKIQFRIPVPKISASSVGLDSNTSELEASGPSRSSCDSIDSLYTGVALKSVAPSLSSTTNPSSAYVSFISAPPPSSPASLSIVVLRPGNFSRSLLVVAEEVFLRFLLSNFPVRGVDLLFAPTMWEVLDDERESEKGSWRWRGKLVVVFAGSRNCGGPPPPPPAATVAVVVEVLRVRDMSG